MNLGYTRFAKPYFASGFIFGIFRMGNLLFVIFLFLAKPFSHKGNGTPGQDKLRGCAGGCNKACVSEDLCFMI